MWVYQRKGLHPPHPRYGYKNIKRGTLTEPHQGVFKRIVNEMTNEQNVHCNGSCTLQCGAAVSGKPTYLPPWVISSTTPQQPLRRDLSTGVMGTSWKVWPVLNAVVCCLFRIITTAIWANKCLLSTVTLLVTWSCARVLCLTCSPHSRELGELPPD